MKQYLFVLYHVIRAWFRPAIVTCETCPNWIVHSRINVNLPGVSRWKIVDGHMARVAGEEIKLANRIGICRLDQPKIYNSSRIGFAFRAWHEHAWCGRHPLHNPLLIAGSDLEYSPEKNPNAGMNRLPTLAEAMELGQRAEILAKAEDRFGFATMGPFGVGDIAAQAKRNPLPVPEPKTIGPYTIPDAVAAAPAYTEFSPIPEPASMTLLTIGSQLVCLECGKATDAAGKCVTHLCVKNGL